ncbi:hypothetical protein MBLNU457_4087t1 [Dothideomycetes sp. NU457]
MATSNGEPHAAEAVGAPPAVAAINQAAREQVVDPYNVSGGTDEHGNTKAIDYEELRKKFNTPALTDDLLQRFEKVTGKPAHRLMRRQLFFSHRDFDKILDHYEKYGFFMLYTGRGPSSDSMHLGHAVPFLFTKELQELFDIPLVIMLTDDEKFYHTRNKNQGEAKPGTMVDDYIQFALQNAKDIIALGFDQKKTFIYTDYTYMGGHFYQNITEFESLLTNNQVRGAMGFDGSTNIGLNAYPAKQCVAAFPTSYPTLFGRDDWDLVNGKRGRRTKDIAAIPTLIPCAIDQEPYFRLLRDNCGRMECPSPKTALILSKFLTALQGPGGKMSASDPTSAIFMSDTPNQIKNKINKYAFSGGGATLEEHKEHGGNPDVDVAFAYLSYFLESDEELKEIETTYRAGTLMTGDLKKKCITELQKFIGEFQERRLKVTDEVMTAFMTPRKLEFNGNPHIEVSIPAEAPVDDQSSKKGSKRDKKKADKEAGKKDLPVREKKEESST